MIRSLQHSKTLLSIFFICFSMSLTAQTVVRGVIRDKATNETLIGAAISVKGKNTGVITDIDGKWELKFDDKLPVTLICSYLGYRTIEFTVTKTEESFALRMEPEEKVMSEVKVVGERVSQKLKESPVTIERLGIQEIKQTAAVGFYEGLSALKGVDMTSASLGFKIINTRGFNSTSPVRTLQIIDGVDNQAPGLNFSLGNFVGASEIDVEKVDIVVGANSATYGPNAFNGVIDMTTKDPYKYEGVNVMLKGAQRNLFEGAVRVAHVSKEMNTEKYSDGLYQAYAKFNNNLLKDRFAYKLNVSYLTAYDWTAVNYGPTASSFNGEDAAGSAGYDGVNIYGESRYSTFTKKYPFHELGFPGSNLANRDIKNYPSYWQTDTLDGKVFPALYVYRTGYKESDLTNYNTYSLKLQGSLYYKLPNNIGTLSYGYNYGNGTTVYQGDNRYSIKDIKFMQQKLELKGDRHYIRAYQTKEDAGKSYDLVFTAYKLLQAAKEDVFWYDDFKEGAIKAKENGITDKDQAIRYARNYADGVGNPDRKSNNQPFFEPGTARFDSAFAAITSNPSFRGGGTRFQDASYMRHIQGQYDFDLSKIKSYLPKTFKVGGNYRYFNPNSNGTIFSDTLVDRNDESKGFTDIHTWEYGLYASTEKAVYNDHIKFIASLRYDDHQNFKPFYTPALSTVVNIAQIHNLRLTYSTAYRNPTLQDQYLLYDIGVAQLRGNLTGFDVILPSDYFGPKGYLTNSQDNYRPIHIDPVRPEHVRSLEIGYKGIAFKSIYVDLSAYRSVYNNFLGYIVGFVDLSKNGQRLVETRPTRIAANSNSEVITNGWSIGLNYFFPKYFNLGGNYTFSELTKRDNSDPLIPFFNTPKHKYNLNFGGRDINNFGFNIAYKFVQGFDYYGSPQFTGPIESYDLVDVQINYTFPKHGTTFKAGSSNVLNNLHYEAYGAPLLGRLVYFSVNYQFNK